MSCKRCQLFVLPTLEEQDDLKNLWQDGESAVSGGAPGAAEDAVEPMSTSREDEDWELKDAIGSDRRSESDLRGVHPICKKVVVL